jgi:hypothetical protein
LVNEAAEADEVPSVHRRLELLAEALAFAFEVTDATEVATFELIVGDDVAPGQWLTTDDRRPSVEAIRFVDPLRRDETRELSRHRNERATQVQNVRAAAEALKRQIGGAD